MIRITVCSTRDGWVDVGMNEWVSSLRKSYDMFNFMFFYNLSDLKIFVLYFRNNERKERSEREIYKFEFYINNKSVIN